MIQENEEKTESQGRMRLARGAQETPIPYSNGKTWGSAERKYLESDKPPECWIQKMSFLSKSFGLIFCTMRITCQLRGKSDTMPTEHQL
jgi:hypothetical protein